MWKPVLWLMLRGSEITALRKRLAMCVTGNSFSYTLLYVNK